MPISQEACRYAGQPRNIVNREPPRRFKVGIHYRRAYFLQVHSLGKDHYRTGFACAGIAHLVRVFDVLKIIWFSWMPDSQPGPAQVLNNRHRGVLLFLHLLHGTVALRERRFTGEPEPARILQAEVQNVRRGQPGLYTAHAVCNIPHSVCLAQSPLPGRDRCKVQNITAAIANNDG